MSLKYLALRLNDTWPVGLLEQKSVLEPSTGNYCVVFVDELVQLKVEEGPLYPKITIISDLCRKYVTLSDHSK